MRCINVFVVVLLFLILFASCSTVGSGQIDYFGFKTSIFTVVAEEDTHGGFQGDGSYYLILDCSDKPAQAIELTKDWNSLPLSENLHLIMYGGEKDGVYYGYNLAEKANWPIIKNGVYKFVDRHEESIDMADDTNLFERYSFNFAVAVYDLDTHTLYYFEFDT